MYKKQLSSAWAKYYTECVKCGTTQRKHHAHGLCTRCYGFWKWINNKEALLDYQAALIERKKGHYKKKWGEARARKDRIAYNKYAKEYYHTVTNPRSKNNEY